MKSVIDLFVQMIKILNLNTIVGKLINMDIHVILKYMNVKIALIVHIKKIAQNLKEIDKYIIIQFMKNLKQM